jgi:ubiquinone/menaquinone biosynthesis C-methylase UbiE
MKSNSGLDHAFDEDTKGFGMNLRPAFEKFYARSRDVLAPGLKSSQWAYREMLFANVTDETDWLDLGCGHQLFPKWMPGWEKDQEALSSRCKSFVGIDYDLRSLVKHRALTKKVRGNIEHLPFKDQSFDLITANVVLEHVKEPISVLKEVRRILKPGGNFLFHTPNLVGYTTTIARLLPDAVKLKIVPYLQARPQADVFPTFYRFNSPATVRALAEEAGFSVTELRAVETSAQMVMLGPIVVFELLLIRALRSKRLENLRTNLVAVLQKT